MSPNRRAITVQLTFDDACDGVVRLVNEAQRLGYTMRALTVDVQPSETVAELRLLVPEEVDVANLASKFSRNPGSRGPACIWPGVPDPASADPVVRSVG